MSDREEEEEEAPRRGGRSRKQVDRFGSGGAAAGHKGKRRPSKDGVEEEDGEEEDEEGSEEGAQPALAKTKQRAANGVRKPRASKGKQGKKSISAANGEEIAAPEAELVEGIKTDNPLFNALLSADIALHPLIDDWVETYQDAAADETSEAASVHELVTFCIRACGLNSTIEQAEATDVDGVGDALETIQDESVKTALAIYPLIAKTKAFRTLRTNLNIFIPHLIKTLSLTPLLYDTTEDTKHSSPILDILLNWLHLMSTSALRPIRHTSTYFVLKINTALCDVAMDVSKDLSTKQRQRENESKKGGVSAAYQKRLREAESRVKEAHERKVRLEEYMQEVFDVMFVHRVRDADPAIRTDCLRELGQWVKRYPEKYVSTSYLNYFTRGCNDPSSHARSETVKALSALFTNESFANKARTVTMRLAPRLVEMALRDIDLSVRVTALCVVTAIDKSGVLADEDEDQREQVARLVFDQEPRIRKAVGSYLHGLWREAVEALESEWSGIKGARRRRAADIADTDMDNHLQWKSLARLLVDTSKTLDQEQAEPSTSRNPITASSNTQAMTRALAAVEACWADIDILHEWEQLAEYLLLDHSTADQDIWLLNDEEENFMLQVFIACIQHEEKDNDNDEKSRTLMHILPRLFLKHQTDVTRMVGVLSIPDRMNLGVYLDLNKRPAYDSLWDDVTRQFLHHTDPSILNAAIAAINHLSSNAAMLTSNVKKLSELEEALFSSLRDAIHGQEVFAMSLDEDQVGALEAILLRVNLLGRSRDLTASMEDEEGGQSSGWEIVCAFAERATVGYKEEAQLVDRAIQTIFLHLSWLFKAFTAQNGEDEVRISALKEKRDRAAGIFEKLAEPGRNNAVDSARRQALICFINTHVLFSKRSEAPAAKACPLSMADEIQHKLGGAFSAMIERYASDQEELENEGNSERTDRRQGDFVFAQLVSVFVGAVRCGVVDLDHAKEPLAHYGRFGPTYDAIVRKLVDVLRDEGIYNEESETVQHICRSALQDSFLIFLDSTAEEPAATIALGKLVASAFVIHGTHFSILKQLHPSDACDLQLFSIDWIMEKVSSSAKKERSAKTREEKGLLARKRAQSLSYFKVLISLLGPVTSRDCLRIKSHLTEQLAGTGIKVNEHKMWVPMNAYIRRVDTSANKDPEVKGASKQAAQGKPTKNVANEEEEEDSDPEPRMNGRHNGHPANGSGRKSRPTSQAAIVPAKRGRAVEEDENEVQVEDPEEADEAEETEDPEESGEREDHQVPGEPEEPELHVGMDLDDQELDTIFDLPSQASSGRNRSPSVEPTVKRRRTVRNL